MRAPDGVEPRADAELLRVLQAAGQAAQQSRRRQIDGAIVLAAIVGDGKSPAAGLLKAHGLTFEEAIRALQKATTTANAKARSQLYAPSGKPQPVTAAPATASSAGGDAETPAVPAADGEEPDPATPQSVDEILAAARARIQARSIMTPAAKPEPAASPQPTPPAETRPMPLSSLASAAPPPAASPPDDDDDVTQDDPEAAPPQRAAAAPPPASAPRPGWTPPPAPPAVQPPGRVPPQTRPAAGFQGRPPRPGKGSQRSPAPPQRPDAPPPQLGRPGGAIQPGLPPPPQQAPWPYPPQPGHPGTGRSERRARRAAPLPAATRLRDRAPAQRTGGQGGGPLVETIPRRMRLGRASSAQVRIARDKIDGLIMLLLSGRGMAHRSEGFITRALSVRLRAPDGGFAIEPGSPETQWVETAPGLQHDEFVNWRWSVTPQRRGRGRLLLIVTVRIVGRDGLATETAPPDRVIEVSVKGGRLRRLMRWTWLLTVLALGVAIGRFGTEFWALGWAAFKRIAG